MPLFGVILPRPEKFKDHKLTAKGEPRAFVEAKSLDTVWFNTGTLCNLQCGSCYIESSPKNDRLSYITVEDVSPYLSEIKQQKFKVSEIAFTGGEPFMNKSLIEIFKLCLVEGFEVLVLTNAMLPMQKKSEELLSLKKQFGEKIKIRVSLDHYSDSMHSKERGENSWEPALKGLKWLSDNDFNLSLASRTLWGESDSEMRQGFKALFEKENISIESADPESLILFPEMDESIDVPEITEACWGILDKSPESVMCSNSRMIVKRSGHSAPIVLACTLLAYDSEFELGSTLKESMKPIYLNHPHCSKFCVLGGASCSK